MEVSSQDDGMSSIRLLEDAADWPHNKLEEEASSLLDCARKVLLDPSAAHEMKMESFTWMADRLLQFVPVFELEDSVYCPMLEAVLIFMEEVLSELSETEEQNRVAFLSMVEVLLEHTGKLVKHAGKQEGCGLGEVPSLARLLPQVVLCSFNRLVLSGTFATNQELKGAVKHVFSATKELMNEFIEVVGQMKIRSVLEDELEILTSLCRDLVSLHQALLPLEFRATLGVWKLYLSLTSGHQARLSDRLDFSVPTEIICQEVVNLLDKVRELVHEQVDHSKEVDKAVNKMNSLIKVVIRLGDTLGPEIVSKECQHLVKLLLNFSRGLPSLATWVGETLKHKLYQELLSTNTVYKLLSLASSSDQLVPYLLQFYSESLNNVRSILLSHPFCSVQVTVKLLLLLRPVPGQSEKSVGQDKNSLFQLVCSLMSVCGQHLDKGEGIEGRTVPGQSPVKVDNYTWVLTNLCAWLSTVSPTQMPMVEWALISTLVIPNTTVLGCQLVSDLWCFMARYGSGQLCLDYLTLLTKLYQHLPTTTFSCSTIFISILIGRLHNLLGEKDRETWRGNSKQIEDTKMTCLISPSDKDLNQLAMTAESGLSNLVPFQVDSFTENLLLATHLVKEGSEQLSSLRLSLANCVRITWVRLANYKPHNNLSIYRLMLALTEATLSVVKDLFSSGLNSLLSQMVKIGEFQTKYIYLSIVKIVRVVVSHLGSDTRSNIQSRDLTVRLVEMLMDGCSDPSLVYLIKTARNDLVSLYPDLSLTDNCSIEEDMEMGNVITDKKIEWPPVESRLLADLINRGEQQELIRACSQSKRRKLSEEDNLDKCINNLNSQVDYLKNIVVSDGGLHGDRRDKVVNIVQELEGIIDLVT